MSRIPMAMIEPLISLAFSIQANRGIYALLLGSGISRSAGIPTGWEVLQDLIERVAQLHGETSEPDRNAWFRNRYGEDPNYSKLLVGLAKSPAERNQLLRGYFEPSDEEREEARKVPTRAHKAIADLVLGNYVQVIVTTNFDRLMEHALEAVGITPTVIDSPDKIDSAMPLTHSRCTVIKLHGDYMDIRIKNTPEELTAYDDRMNGILDRVFDEYGLVVCGWSADYDMALESAIARCASRRFTTYWAAKTDLGEAARRLVELRKAEVIKIESADGFFHELNEKVKALAKFDNRNPLSVQASVAAAKKYLAEDKFEIELHDLLTRETTRLLESLSDKNLPANHPPNQDAFLTRIGRYEAACETVLALMVLGSYRSEKHEKLWSQVLTRIGNPFGDYTGLFRSVISGLQLYPALLLQYGGGVASVAGNNYRNLYHLLVGTRLRVINQREPEPTATSLAPGLVFESNEAQWFEGIRSERFAANEHLFQVLRMPLAEILPQNDEYKNNFARFEYLLALVYADQHAKHRKSDYFFSPGGLFISEPWLKLRERSIVDIVNEEARQLRDSWPPLQAGFFDGSYDRFERVLKNCLDEDGSFKRY